MTRSSYTPLLDFGFIQPQTLDTGFPSSDFALELFSEDNLHLPDAIPKFKMIPLKTWYKGLPLAVIAYVVNDRQIPIYSCSLSVKIKDQNEKILEKNAPAVLSLEPQKTTSLRIDFLPPHEGKASLECTFKYQVDNVPYTLKRKLHIDIQPSVILECKSYPSPLKVLQFTIRNMLPFILYDVIVSTEVNESIKIEQHLNPKDVYNGILEITKPHLSLTVSFTARNFIRAFTTIKCEKPKEIPPQIITVKLDGVPKEWPAMKPFTINLHAQNMSSQTVSGKIVVAELNDSIFVFGNNDLTFNDLKPQEVKDIPIEFVAVKEGTYKFPVFDFYVESYKSFRVTNTEGIIVVGYNDDEKI